MQSYRVAVQVNEVKELVVGDQHTEIEAFVTVECVGNKWGTTVKEHVTGDAVFGQTHTWHDIPLFEEQFDSAFVVFKVWSKHYFTKNALLGQATMQLASIWRRRDHVFRNKWLILREEKQPAARGNLSISIFCLKPGEPPPSFQVEEEEGSDDEVKVDDADNLQAGLVVGSLAQMTEGKAYHINVNIHRVEELAKIGNAHPIPYVTVEFGNTLLKTEAASSPTELHNFNVTCKFPLKTPVYEDSIIIKLWHHGWLVRPEPLAQGFLSWSVLRNTSMDARWFNLYGWNPDEVPDIEAIWRTGERILPNCFKGRLLVSARVEALDSDADLKEARVSPLFAGTFREPQRIQKTLLADVYEVTGEIGRECQVSVSYGNKVQTTYDWVVGTRSKRDGADFDEEKSNIESTVSFKFEQQNGRLDPLRIMTSEDETSQAKVVIDVYTTGVVSGKTRVGYTMKSLSEIPLHESGKPALPKYFPLETLPHAKQRRIRPSILIVIEQTGGEGEVMRHNRRRIHPTAYIVRAYIFMARSILRDEPQDYAVRVSCASVSETTNARHEVRPLWMEVLSLKVMLNADHPHEPPTMEPISLTLCSRGIGFDKDIAETIAIYTHMRRKDGRGVFEPFRLEPQWVVLKGGQYKGRTEAELLVAFELLRWRDRDEVKAKEMWPVGEQEFEEDRHFCKLLKARFDFALYGLRDVIRPSGFQASSPVVQVNVKKFSAPATSSVSSDNDDQMHFHCEFEYDKVPEQKVKNGQKNLREPPWVTSALGRQDCMNFEFLNVQSMDVELPENFELLEPCFSVKVTWKRNMLAQARDKLISGLWQVDASFVGEYRQSLQSWLPCAWYKAVDLSKNFGEQEETIRRAMSATKQGEAQQAFVEQSNAERTQQLRNLREIKFQNSPHKKLVKDEKTDDREDKVNSEGVPPQFEPYNPVTNPNGHRVKVTLTLRPAVHLNMFQGCGFGDIEGELVQISEHTRASVVKLEDCAPNDKAFSNDFWFANKPLQKHRDFGFARDEKTDWNYDHSNCNGFVKFMIKLTALSEVSQADCPVDERLLRSFFVDDDINKKVFSDPDDFVKTYKNVPSHVRVRLYFQKATCMGISGGSPSPYPRFTLGEQVNTLRNMVVYDTNVPDFREMEEADIELPRDSRLEVTLVDQSTTLLSQQLMNDKVIGSTVIDLEDRWHSDKWQAESKRHRIPVENRPLQYYYGGRSKNMGSIEMWVDMVSTLDATQKKFYDLKKVDALMVEIRIVIWGMKHIPMHDEETIDITSNCVLECSTYGGTDHTQQTDTHFGSKDGHAVFNWRIVYTQIKLPTVSCMTSINVYHKGGALGTDKNVWKIKLDLRKWLDIFAKSQASVFIDKNWVQDEKDDDPDHKDDDTPPPEVLLSVHIVSQIEASQRKVGKGREEPNENPVLSVPEDGRGWDDYLAGSVFNFSNTFPNFGTWKKFLPLFLIVIFTLMMLVLLRWLELL